MRRYRSHLTNRLVKLALVLALVGAVAHGAYINGVRHAIASAQVWAEDGCFLIDFDGEVHEYR